MAKKAPASTKKTIQRLALLGGVLLIIGLLMTAIDWKMGSSLARDTHINIKPINGSRYIAEADVIDIIERKTRQDISTIVIGNLNTRAIEDSIKANPYVLDAEVYVDARDHIYIEIEQREPILRIIAESGNYYISKTGHRVPVTKNDVARVPVATGKIPNYRDKYWESSVNDLTMLYRVADYLYHDDFLRPLIEQIHLDEKSNMFLVPKLGHHNIEFGSDERLEEKFRYLKIFYKEALPYHGWEKYKTISLRYEGQVVGVR